jgi:hypothetical protein
MAQEAAARRDVIEQSILHHPSAAQMGAQDAALSYLCFVAQKLDQTERLVNGRIAVAHIVDESRKKLQ